MIALLRSSFVRMAVGEALRHSLVPIEKLRAEAGWSTEPWSRRVVEEYLRDVKSAAALCRGFGCTTRFFLQPLVYFKNWPTTAEQNWRFSVLMEHVQRCRIDMQRGLDELHHTESIEWTDLSGRFENTEGEVFLDGIHLLQNVQETIADALFETLRPQFETEAAVKDSAYRAPLSSTPD